MLPFESIDNDTDISIRTWGRPTAVGLLPPSLQLPEVPRPSLSDLLPTFPYA
jgi:hypothetical protein